MDSCEGTNGKVSNITCEFTPVGSGGLEVVFTQPLFPDPANISDIVPEDK